MRTIVPLASVTAGALVAPTGLPGPAGSGGPGGGIPDAPVNGSLYGRMNGDWEQIVLVGPGGGGVDQITATAPLVASAATGNVGLSLNTATLFSNSALTGVPTAPTPVAGTNTTQIATTAFVKSAVDAVGGLPAGGAIYDVLSKASGTSGDVEWRGAGVRSNNNTVIGAGAFTTALGNFNAVLGMNALVAATGNSNVAIGNAALQNAADSTSNVAIGNWAMRDTANTSGTVAIGGNSFRWLSISSSQNIAIGTNAGESFGAVAVNFTQANQGIYIGDRVRAGANNTVNEIVIGSSVAANLAIGRGSNTITLGNDQITALYTKGQIYVDGVKIGGFAPSVAWTADTDPDGVSMFVNATGRPLTITAISGSVEVVNGSTATVTVVKAASGTALSAGTPVHGAPFDADLNAGSTQDITPFAGTTLEIGERLGLRATAPAPGWVDSVASITVYLEP